MISYWIDGSDNWACFQSFQPFQAEWLAFYALINTNDLNWNLIETSKKSFHNDGLVQCC